MPHDARGNLLEIGDQVVVRFTVKQLMVAEDYCNVYLEPVIGMPPDGSQACWCTVNTRQTEKVSSGGKPAYFHETRLPGESSAA